MKYINRPIWKDVSPIWNHLFTYLILSGLSVAESGSEELSKPWALFVCFLFFFPNTCYFISNVVIFSQKLNACVQHLSANTSKTGKEDFIQDHYIRDKIFNSSKTKAGGFLNVRIS